MRNALILCLLLASSATSAENTASSSGAFDVTSQVDETLSTSRMTGLFPNTWPESNKETAKKTESGPRETNQKITETLPETSDISIDYPPVPSARLRESVPVGMRLPPPAPEDIQAARVADDKDRAGTLSSALSEDRPSAGPSLVGLVREFEVPRRQETVKSRRQNAGVYEYLSIDATGYDRVRFRIIQHRLTPNDRVWISDGDRYTYVSAMHTAEEGEIWTPSAEGGIVQIIIERVSAPDESVPIMIDAYAEIVEESEPAGRNLSCTEDTQCRSEADFTAIESAEKALAYIQFIADGSIFSCSGGLITDVNPEHTIYYLLTANHCFSTQETASTAEYFFDYKSQSCNGFVPSLNLLPKVSGSTLLVSSPGGDVTLVRLPVSRSISGSRALLGWNANPVPINTKLHRVSHPKGSWARYTRSVMVKEGRGCGGLIKVSNSGFTLMAENPPFGDGYYDWACTMDNFPEEVGPYAGLMWEVKTPPDWPLGDLRGADHTYTWREGSVGNVGSLTSCGQSLGRGVRCNTQAMSDKYNEEQICGASNWQLPSEELLRHLSLVIGAYGAEADEWFPNTPRTWHWTYNQDPFNFGAVRQVRIGDSSVRSQFWDFAFPAKLWAVGTRAFAPRYLFSKNEVGTNLKGSSGSPVMLDNGQIVGQLWGICGSDPCNTAAHEAMDGSFRRTYFDFLSPYLNDEVAQLDLDARDAFLVLDPNNLSTTVTSPRVGDIVYAVALYDFNGDGVLSTKYLSVEWNGNEICSSSGQLEPGAWLTVCRSNPIVIGEGTHTLDVKVDPDDTILETVAGNNTIRRTYRGFARDLLFFDSFE